MPNWCANDLTIKGPKAVLDQIVRDHFREEDSGSGPIQRLSFTSVIPYPEDWRKADEAAEEARKQGNFGMIKDGYNSGGYEWCVKNWGTKWGACKAEFIKRTDRCLRQTFMTAYVPPYPVLQCLSHLFPKAVVTVKFYERGSGFQGKRVYIDGQCMQQWDAKYKGKRGG